MYVKHVTPRAVPLLAQGHNLNKLGRGPLGHATCQIKGCGNSKIFYLSRDKEMAIIYLSNKNFTCPIVQISLYLSVLKQFTLLKTV